MEFENEFGPISDEVSDQLMSNLFVVMDHIDDAFDGGYRSILRHFVPDLDVLAQKPLLDFTKLMLDSIWLGQLVQRLALPPYTILGSTALHEETLGQQDRLVWLLLSGWNRTFSDLARVHGAADGMSRLAMFASRVHVLMQIDQLHGLLAWATDGSTHLKAPIDDRLVGFQRMILAELIRHETLVNHLNQQKATQQRAAKQQHEERTWAPPTVGAQPGNPAHRSYGMPDWAPAWLASSQPHVASGMKGAVMCGITFPLQLMCIGAGKLRIPGVLAVLVGLGLLRSSRLDFSQLNLMASVGAALFVGLKWNESHKSTVKTDAAVGAVVAAVCAVPSTLMIISAFM